MYMPDINPRIKQFMARVLAVYLSCNMLDWVVRFLLVVRAVSATWLTFRTSHQNFKLQFIGLAIHKVVQNYAQNVLHNLDMLECDDVSLAFVY
jgi:hypothetical protein